MNIDWTMALSTVFTGITIVFLVLILLIIVMMLMSKIIAIFSGRNGSGSTSGKKDAAPKAAPAAPAPKAPQMAVEDGVSEEVVAVISAAIAAMMGGAGYAIKSITRARRNENRGGRPIWSLVGMQQNTQPF